MRERCNVGASPIREALSQLSVGGVIRREDPKGFRMALVSVEELIKTRFWFK